MEVDKIIVALLSLFGIGFVYWFFLMKKEKETLVEGNSINIIVNGGYQPENITIPLDKTTTVHFTRQDPSSCLEEVVLSDFKIKKYLPLHKTVSIEITPHKKGVFQFSCGMNMFHGKVKVI